MEHIVFPGFDFPMTWEEAFHIASLRDLARYFARIASTDGVLTELEAAINRAQSRPR